MHPSWLCQAAKSFLCTVYHKRRKHEAIGLPSSLSGFLYIAPHWAKRGPWSPPGPLGASSLLWSLHLGSRPLLQGPGSWTGTDGPGQRCSLCLGTTPSQGTQAKDVHNRIPKTCTSAIRAFYCFAQFPSATAGKTRAAEVNSSMSHSSLHGNERLAPHLSSPPFLRLVQWIGEHLGRGDHRVSEGGRAEREALSCPCACPV